MTEQQNPYSATEAEQAASESGEFVLSTAQALPISAGWRWIAEGFNLFEKSPGLWIGMLVVWCIIMLVTGFIPVLGQLASYIFGPVFMAGFMLGCRELDQGGELRFEHLFAGFSKNTGQLILVGVLYLVGMIIAAIPGFIVMGAGISSFFTGGELNPDAFDEMIFYSGILLMLVLIMPVLMAYWFAPVLVVLHDKPALEAMRMSFTGCLKNVFPYTLYSIVALALCVLAVIPLGLGYFILLPTLLATMYTAYRGIFITN